MQRSGGYHHLITCSQQPYQQVDRSVGHSGSYPVLDDVDRSSVLRADLPIRQSLVLGLLFAYFEREIYPATSPWMFTPYVLAIQVEWSRHWAYAARYS
jgi:hypothetical protein